MSTRKILITGGYGFLGANVARDLLKHTDANVIVLSRSQNEAAHNYILNKGDEGRLQFLKGDITNKDSLQTALTSSDIVIHAAALLRQDVHLNDINIAGTKNVLDAAAAQGVKRFIFVSSAAVYGNLEAGLTMNEDHPLNPVNEYGISKLRAEEQVLSESLVDHLPVTIVRPFNIYGPLQRPPQMIPLFIDKLLHGEPITLNNGGMQFRDWVYIDDVTLAIRMLLNAAPKLINSEVFNIGSGTMSTVRTVAELLLQSLNANKTLLHIGEQTVHEVTGNAADISKIKNVLGWEPKTYLSQGIEKTVSWYKHNLDNDNSK